MQENRGCLRSTRAATVVVNIEPCVALIPLQRLVMAEMDKSSIVPVGHTPHS